MSINDKPYVPNFYLFIALETKVKNSAVQFFRGLSLSVVKRLFIILNQINISFSSISWQMLHNT